MDFRKAGAAFFNASRAFELSPLWMLKRVLEKHGIKTAVLVAREMLENARQSFRGSRLRTE